MTDERIDPTDDPTRRPEVAGNTARVLQATPDPRHLLQRLHEYRSRRDWEEVIAVGRHVPDVLEGREWCDVADAVAFGLGQKRRHREAIALLERVVAVAPTPARFSSLAYLHYDGALCLAVASSRSGRRRDERAKDDRRLHGGGDRQQATDVQREREFFRNGFRRWIAEALRARPDSVKDLYRLGLFEAQVENAHDKPALRAFFAAIRAYRSLDDTTRARRGDLRKAYAKSLYAGARSALRLGRLDVARKLSFALVREDREHDDVEPVFKLSLAGRVCLATKELDAAERAFRLALDGGEPPQRDWLHGYLAQTYLARGNAEAGARWLDAHVPPRRRHSSTWRLRGDLARQMGDTETALRCWEAALERDRMGRHLTFRRIAEVHEAAGRPKPAEQAYRSACEFRRRVHGSDDAIALAGLARVLEARGKRAEAEDARARLAGLAKVRPGRGAGSFLQDPHEAELAELPEEASA
jgi:tetratricopeptide (TPR) repeat protein